MSGSSGAEAYRKYSPGSEELVAILVEENMGWAQAIAKSVARAWKMDWELDGLDGGAYEALLFCARRYDPSMGVPFRAYARKRIHESSTEEARKSKKWQQAVGSDSPEEIAAREVSYRLFHVFPELREGMLPANNLEGEESLRQSVRQMLTSASMLLGLKGVDRDSPETAFEYKQMLEFIAELEPVHQAIVWGIYWRGLSLRALAEEWKIDELTIIREHREIIQYVYSRMSGPKVKNTKKLKVRPSLRGMAIEMKKTKTPPPFLRFAHSTSAILAVLFWLPILLLICLPIIILTWRNEI